MTLIEFHNVSKAFRHGTRAKLLRGHLADAFKPRELFYALSDVSFSVGKGESVALVGRNGAGKSTLLSLVAGLCSPTSGRVDVNGRVAALLELGSGFHPDLSGAENVRLNASLLGMSRKRLDEHYEKIVEFSEIRDFIDEPIRTYSSGMIVRLAFSVAVEVDPEILIVDEVLAAGDQRFQMKCLERIKEHRQKGTTLLFVSHGAEVVRQLCDRAIWLDHGRVVRTGTADAVLNAYAAGTP